MDSSSLISKTAAELSKELEDGNCKAVDVAQAFLDRTDLVDGRVHAFLHRDDEDFIAQAKASDERREKGETLAI